MIVNNANTIINLSFTYHVSNYLGGFHGYPSRKLLGTPLFVSQLVILVGMSDGVERRWGTGAVGLRKSSGGGSSFREWISPMSDGIDMRSECEATGKEELSKGKVQRFLLVYSIYYLYL